MQRNVSPRQAAAVLEILILLCLHVLLSNLKREEERNEGAMKTSSCFVGRALLVQAAVHVLTTGRLRQIVSAVRETNLMMRHGHKSNSMCFPAR